MKPLEVACPKCGSGVGARCRSVVPGARRQPIAIVHPERAAHAAAGSTVPADLEERLRDEAAAMGVPVAWVLRAALELALTDSLSLDLLSEVERVGANARRGTRS